MKWVLLILSLPTRNATGRIRIWRALKQMGCGSLRDGVFLLPARSGTLAFFDARAAEVKAAGGEAHVLVLDAADPAQEVAFRRLFDRAADYAALKADIDTLRSGLKRGGRVNLLRERERLQKTFLALAAIDYFPGAARDHVRMALDELSQRIEATMNPGEPQAAAGKIKRLDRAEYQGRFWATRRNLWVDRMASAWLIARFIDQRARFKWLVKPDDCPKRALGFDFDGATFTHVGSRVTFEVLVASFGLEDDAALARIGAIVHVLDVGGVPMVEAAGLEVVLKGLRETAKDDDALLAAIMPVFDGLYAAFGNTD